MAAGLKQEMGESGAGQDTGMSAPDHSKEHVNGPPAMAMMQLIASGWVARAIHVAAKLGLPDLLRDGAVSSADLAQATQTHAPFLSRLLRALAAVGVVAESREGRFSLTPLGATLCTDAPLSLRAWVEFALGEEAYSAWGSLLHTVRTGETAFDHLYGMGVWEHRTRNAEHARLFDAAMSSQGGPLNDAAIARYPFAEIEALVDVGGGDGSLLIALLKKYPLMRGLLLELPQVAERAKRNLAGAGLSSRCDVVAGDAFGPLPSGADAYVLSRVIHDWADAEALEIMKNCCRAMREDARLILIERVLPARAEASAAAAMLFVPDLNMMVMHGGRERSEDEFRTLFHAAGLRLKRIVPTHSPVSVIEAARK